MVASKTPRQHGSNPDIVAFFQFVALSPISTNFPRRKRVYWWLRILRSSSFPSRPENSHTTTCSWIILYVDLDILPLNNMDYVFDLSDSPDATLEENMVMATRGLLSNGGFFMLRHGGGGYEQLQGIIAHQMHNAKTCPIRNSTTSKGGAKTFRRSVINEKASRQQATCVCIGGRIMIRGCYTNVYGM